MPPSAAPSLWLDLAIVVPTFNERENVAELVQRLDAALTGLSWEVVFVDDDSPDGTADAITALARRDSRVRLLQRVGRRGLSSACIEGILATTASCVAVMDADMQHDETILPQMLAEMRQDSLDLVIGTRNAEGGNMGEFSRRRVALSRVGHRVSRAVCRCDVSDAMSGYFLVHRSFFSEVVHALQGGGFKILVDMLASARRPVRFAEVGYTFSARRFGESKLDVNTGVEYLMLVVEKLTAGIIPARFTAFSLVGATGVGIHILSLMVLTLVFHVRFFPAQIVATYIAMTENFFINNFVTWRDRKLRGLGLVSGLASFWVACSFGAWANVIFARSLYQAGSHWYVAGIAGIVLSSVWNYSISNLFTWQTRRPSYTQELAAPPVLTSDTVN